MYTVGIGVRRMAGILARLVVTGNHTVTTAGTACRLQLGKTEIPSNGFLRQWDHLHVPLAPCSAKS